MALTRSDNPRPWHRYAVGIRSGAIPACAAMRKTVERYFAEIVRDDVYLDETEAARVLHFCKFITHHKGELAGQPFKVEDWEAFILVNALCMKWRDTGFNKYREIFVFVPRKNGKTFIASTFSNYLLIADPGQHDLFTYAKTAGQARLAFDGCKQQIQQSKALSKRAKVFAHHVDSPASKSRLKPISSNTGGNEGLGGSSVCDELHTHPDGELFSVMQLAMAARRRAWHFIITTAGTSTTSFCKQFYDQCKQSTSETLFSAIYELDDPSEMDDPTQWIKANPNLGVSVFADEIANSMETARLIPSQWAEFQTKRFNRFTSGEQEFISAADWAACHIPDESSPIERQPVYVGIDLSAASDITSVYCVQPTGAIGEVRVWGYNFLPRAALERGKKNAGIYAEWVREGHLTIAGERTIDYEHIERKIYELAEIYDLQSVSFDPWNCNQTLTRLESNGIPVEKVRQGFISLSAPTKALQVAVIQQKVIHGDDPILNWAIGNVCLATDAAANIKVDKLKSESKVDPVAALLNAYRTWSLEAEQGQIDEAWSVAI